MRESREVIRSKILSVSSADNIVRPVGADVFSNPINFYVGTHVWAAVKQEIKTDPHVSVTWKQKKEDGSQSAVGCLRIYSDKSQTSFTASPFVLYLIHITVFNFTKDQRRKQIVLSALLPGYLPAGYSEDDHQMRRKTEKSMQLPKLHHCVNYVLKPLLECAVERILSETSNNGYLLLYLMIASYVADLPKSKDFLSVKRCNQTAMQSYVCEDRQRNLSLYSRALRRCWEYV